MDLPTTVLANFQIEQTVKKEVMGVPRKDGRNGRRDVRWEGKREREEEKEKGERGGEDGGPFSRVPVLPFPRVPRSPWDQDGECSTHWDPLNDLTGHRVKGVGLLRLPS